MLIKAGVDISRLNPKIRKALNEIDDAYASIGEEFIITSTYEGNHSAGSLHYANDALDGRKPETGRISVLTIIREKLGPDFDIISEVDHIHFEYDPKT